MVKLAGIGWHDRVLEPSAGTGNLLRAIVDAEPAARIHAVEINRALCGAIPSGFLQGGETLCQDFLTCTVEQLGRFDKILMNPPFHNGADVAHVKHALRFLEKGRRTRRPVRERPAPESGAATAGHDLGRAARRHIRRPGNRRASGTIDGAAMKKRRNTFVLGPAPGFEAAREYVKEHPLPVPPTVRECAAQGLSSYGLPPSRMAMSPAHTRELLERYPGLYRHADDKPVPSCEPFAREGFACGDGWFAIIDRLSAKLVADPNLVVSQAKEKMGLLTVYFNASELASPEIEAATDAALHDAREESRGTCEVCGELGTHKKRGHHVSVICVPCEWLDEIVEACLRLRECVQDVTLPVFAVDLLHLESCQASRSTPGRGGEPPVAGAQGEVFPASTGTGSTASARFMAPTVALNILSPEQIWNLVRDDVPVLEEILQ